MPLTPDEYAESGFQDYHDVMARGADTPWRDEKVWDFDGVKVTEKQFQEAWEHFDKTGERPDWWTNRQSKPGVT